MTRRARTQIFLRLELGDALRSRWLLFTTLVYAVAFGSFVWLGLRESSVLGFTGMSRVVLNLSNALVLTLPLVALVSTNQSVVRARSGGFFELFLAQPCGRSEWLEATVLSRLIILLGPIAAILLGALVLGASDSSDRALAPMVFRSLVVSASLAWAFVGLGFLISAYAKNPERATVLAMLAWLAGSMLHDFALIGALLEWRLPPEGVFALAAANPVESARIAILSAVDPELSVLGPVGFWLANTLGPKVAFAIGVGWPFSLGLLALLGARRRLERMDLVG